MSDSRPAFLGQVAYLDTKILDRITDEMKPKARKIVNKYGLAIASSWAKDVNVDTSAFRNSILSESQMTDDLTFTASDGVDYGIWQELGTSRMAARPSLSTAFEMWRDKFLNEFEDLFK